MWSLRALLIQKSVKPPQWLPVPSLFESFVNSEECKTKCPVAASVPLFESFVNSEECKT